MSDQYTSELYINNSSDTIPYSSISLQITDSIHSLYPTIQIAYNDSSGQALELGSFTNGISLKTILGLGEDLIESEFIVTTRDTLKHTSSFPLLSGELLVNGVHKSFIENRNSPNKAYKEKLVSEVVTDLLANEQKKTIETTVGKLSTFVYSDPYTFITERLLELATNDKVSPFYFFKDLQGEIYFSSYSKLMKGSSVGTFKLTKVANEITDVSNNINAFLPFTNDIEKNLIRMRTQASYIDKDLEFKADKYSIKSDEPDTIPFIGNSQLSQGLNLVRAITPKVEYDKLTKGIASNSMKHVIEKAIVSIPFNSQCLAGKVITLEIDKIDLNGSISLSEYYSGDYLIEKSSHISRQDGVLLTELVVNRIGVIPINNSQLKNLAFKDS